MTAEGTWSGAAGKADGVHDVQVDSQFGIASITKSVIAAQVMQLVEAGELALDAPGDRLPPRRLHLRHQRRDDPPAPRPCAPASRIGTATPWRSEVATDRKRVWTPAEVLALVGPARRPAGSRVRIHGHQLQPARARDRARSQATARRRPARRRPPRRRDGAAHLPARRGPDRPHGHAPRRVADALEQGGGYLPSLSDASSAGPAGAIASDSISLARWWRAFCAGEVVSQASLTEMSTFVGGPDGYGLGLFNPSWIGGCRASGTTARISATARGPGACRGTTRSSSSCWSIAGSTTWVGCPYRSSGPRFRTEPSGGTTDLSSAA